MDDYFIVNILYDEIYITVEFSCGAYLDVMECCHSDAINKLMLYQKEHKVEIYKNMILKVAENINETNVDLLSDIPFSAII